MSALLWVWVWVLTSSSAWATVLFDVCVDVDMNVVDHAGDYWITNTNDRDGRGFRVGIQQTSPAGTTWQFADDDGCVRDFPLSTASQNVYVHVKSEARVSGVDLHSWSGPSDDGTRERETIVFLTNPAVDGLSQNLTLTPSGTQEKSVWRNLLVATMVFRSSDWNVDTAPSRDCCVPGTQQANGTCTTPANEYVPFDLPIQLQAFKETQSGNQDGAQSRLVRADGTDHPSGRGDNTSLPGVYSHFSNEKREIAHELGHVILAHRAGGQEAVNAAAAMDGCVGSFSSDGTPVPYGEYGYLTKEFQSLAWKEGWADFVAVVASNDDSESDCDLQNPGREEDWDLDGTLDIGPSFRTNHPWDYRTNRGVDVPIDQLMGTIDCEGDPDVEGFTPDPYTWSPSYTVNARNWLADLEAAGASGCAATSYPAEENRTTRYDVVRMSWDLRTDRGLSQVQLSNLAVNTCFRTWLPGAGASGSNDARLPWRRLEASASALGLTTEFQAEDDHVWH